MNKLIKTIITILALHLWYTNADLLITAKSIAEDRAPLSGFTLTVLGLFALSYSVLSAIAVVKIKHYIYVAIFALLDGFAIYLRINVDQQEFLFITSVFYAIYTAYIITVCWLLNRSQQPTPTTEAQPIMKKKQPELPSTEEKTEYISAIRKISASKDKQKAITEIVNSTNNEDLKAYLRQKYSYIQTELAL